MNLFDCHFHVVDPRFPLVPNEGFLPEAFTCTDYLRRTARLGVFGGGVSYQQLPGSASDDEIAALHEAGVRGVRFNLHRGGAATLTELERLAHRVHDLVGWHAELYVDAKRLGPMRDWLLGLPSVSIDHLGLSRDGSPCLLALAERGVRVKASGFAPVNFDVRQALRELWTANPDCLMFGTDLLSTRAPRSFADSDVDLVIQSFDDTAAAKILSGNAAAFYRLDLARSLSSP